MPPPLVQTLKSAFDDEGVQAHIRALKEIRDLEREIGRMKPRGGGSPGGSGGGSGVPGGSTPRVPKETAQAMRDLREATALARIEFDKLNLANRRGELSNEKFQASVSELRQKVTRDIVAVRNRFEELPRAVEIQYGRSAVALDRFATRAQEVATGQTRLRTRITQGIQDALAGAAYRVPGGGALVGAGIGGGALAAGAVGLAGAAGLGKAAAMAISYEKALAEVRKTTGLTAEATDRLGDDLLDMSARLGVGERDLATIAAQAGQLGIQGTRDIATFAETVAKFSAVSEMSAEESALALGKVGVAFGLPVAEAERLGSVINELSNTTAASSRDIVDGLRRVGPVGKEIGLTADEVAAMTATLVESGIESERAGTQIRNILTVVQTKMGEVAKMTGVSAEAFQGMITEDAYGALMRYFQQLEKMPPTLRTIHLDDVFGKENITGMQVLAAATADGADGISRLARNTETAAKAWREGTSLSTEYAVSLDNVAGQWALFRQNIAAAATDLGGRFTPALKSVLQGVNMLADETAALSQQLAVTRIELGSVDEADRLLRTYEELTGKTNLTKEEQERLRQVTERLTALYPEYIRNTDDATGSVVLYADALRAALVSQRELLQSQQGSQIATLVEQFRDAAAAVDELRLKQKDLAAEQVALDKGQGPRRVAVGTGPGGFAMMPRTMRVVSEELEKIGGEAKVAGLNLDRAALALSAFFRTAEGKVDYGALTRFLVGPQVDMDLREAKDLAIQIADQAFRIAELQRTGTLTPDPDPDPDPTGPPVDANAQARAEESLRKTLAMQSLRLAKTLEEKAAMGRIQEIEERIRKIKEDQAVLGTEATAEVLANELQALEAAEAQLDYVRQTVTTWEQFEPAARFLPDAEVFDLTPDATLDAVGELLKQVEAMDLLGASISELRAGLGRLREAEVQATGIQRENIRQQIKEWEVLLGLAEDTEVKVKKVGQAWETWADSGRAVLRLADALGLVSDELSNIAGGALDAVGAIGNLQKTREMIGAGELTGAAGAASLAGAYVGIAAGAASVVAGILAPLFRDEAAQRRQELEARREEVRQRAEEAKEFAQALRDNARSISASISRLIRETRIGSGVSGETAKAAEEAFGTFAGTEQGATSNIRGLQRQIEDLDLLLEQSAISLTEYTERRGDLLMLIRAEEMKLGKAFRSLIASLEEGGLLSEEQAAEYRTLYENLLKDGRSSSEAIEAILAGTADGMTVGLREFIQTLTGGLGGFASTVEGAVAGLEVFRRLLGQDLPAALTGFIDLLSRVPDLSADLQTLLAEARGLTSDGELSEADRERLQEIARTIAERAFGPGAADFLSGLTPEQAQAIAEAFLNAGGAGQAGEGSEITRGVNIARSITEIQANELVAIGDAQLYALQRMTGLLQTVVGLLAGRGGASRNPVPEWLDRVRGGASSSVLSGALARLTAPRPAAPGLQALRAAGAGGTAISFGPVSVSVQGRRGLSEDEIQEISRRFADTLRRRASDPFNPLGR